MELIIRFILGLLFGFSAFLKLSGHETAIAQSVSFGIPPDTYRIIGVIEAISVILFLIHSTGLIGSLLLIAYMGGAIASHLQHQQSIFVAVLVEILIWVDLLFRYRALRRYLLGTDLIDDGNRRAAH
ncbi:DoxX family protein [Dyadobacter sp. CY261]|uniref:DoxX family protein n=1 Tax=Dyadobacter sp. CY261 TaxID=2907203 RepID=UPI001F46C1C0|nr:DoxX family protein [Dyadobacter sp. CY261]MCF0074229.1 DoxX family protein [Dyadobacter sp. CY261]